MTEISGYILDNNEKIAFVANDYSFTFFNTSSENKTITLKTDDSGYIFGRTYDDKVIAIYSERDVEVKTTRKLNTWNYILLNNYLPKKNIDLVKMIRFENGVVKTIYPCNALHMVLDECKGNRYVYEYKKDCIEYKTIMDEEVTWRFSSVVNQKLSIDEGDSLSNSTSLMDIIFKTEKDHSIITNYWKYAFNLCSFLTFRGDISFESIKLFYDDHNEIGELFVNKNMKTKYRKSMEIITVRGLEPTNFEKIILNIWGNDKEQPGLPLTIIPKDKSEVNLMDASRIRTICSAMEKELDLQGVKISTHEDVVELVRKVKMDIDSVKEKSKLDEKSFSPMYSSLSHWKQPLSERVLVAWEQHEKEINAFCKRYRLDVTKEDIIAFVKARNNMTHAGVTAMSEQVANAAFTIIGLIYCCTLSRIGMESTRIEDIMSRGIIG